MSTRKFLDSKNNNIIEVDSSKHSESTQIIAGTHFGIKPTFDFNLSFDQQNTTDEQTFTNELEDGATADAVREKTVWIEEQAVQVTMTNLEDQVNI